VAVVVIVIVIVVMVVIVIVVMVVIVIVVVNDVVTVPNLLMAEYLLKRSLRLPLTALPSAMTVAACAKITTVFTSGQSACTRFTHAARNPSIRAWSSSTASPRREG
jgi:hypothetical protein